MLQPLNYKQAVIEALESKDLTTLKDLHQLKNKKQIFLIDNIEQLKDLTPDNETGYLFAPSVKQYLEGKFISSVLYGTPDNYEGIYIPTMTAEQIKQISEKLEIEC